MKCRICGQEQGLDASGRPLGLSRDFVKQTCTCEKCWATTADREAVG